MGYTKKEKEAADLLKKDRAITFKIIEELHFLTGLSFPKLAAYIDAAQKKIEFPPENPIYTIDLRSRSALYREAKKVNLQLVKELKSVKELKVKSIKKGQGQLRVRIIEIQIYYGKNVMAVCDKKNKVKQYEIFRWLCGYEVQSRYFAYQNLPDQNFPPTQNFIMNCIKDWQNKLKIPFESIVFTQNILNHQYNNECERISWDWVNSDIVKSLLIFEFEKHVTMKEMNFPSSTDEYFIEGLTNKQKFVTTFEEIVKNYNKNGKLRLKEQQKKHANAYESFTNELTIATDFNNTDYHALGKVIRSKNSAGNNFIKFDTIAANKKLLKLEKRTENIIEERFVANEKATQDLVRKFGRPRENLS